MFPEESPKELRSFDMTKKVNFYRQGLGLVPVSADPTGPESGQLQMSDGTVRAAGLWRYDGSDWVAVGSGGGGLDVFHTEDFESTGASDFTTGNAATVDAAGTGTLDGTLADETTLPISSDASLKYTAGSSSTNDFFLQDADISIDSKQVANDIGITFYYAYVAGSDDDIRFFVLDQDDNELTSSIEYLKSASTATRFSTSVYVPSGTTGLRYGFQVVSGTASALLLVDDFELSTNPFVYKNLVETGTYRADTHAGYGSTATFSPYFTNVRENTVTQFGTITNDSTDGWRFTASRNCSVNISYTGGADSGGNDFIGISKNANPATALFSLTADKRLSSSYQSAASVTHVASASTDLAVGDYINLHNQAATVFSNTDRILVTMNVSSSSEHVVTPAKSNMSDPESWVPTLAGFGTVTDLNANYYREGKFLSGDVSFTAGTTSATLSKFSLPSGLNIDSSFLSVQDTKLGDGNVTTSTSVDISTSSNNEFAVFSDHVTTTTELFLGSNLNTNASGFTYNKENTSSYAGTGANVSFRFKVPIAEWTSDATFLAAIPKNYSQTKILSADVTSTTTASDLTFNNLIIGKSYNLSTQMSLRWVSGGSGATVTAKNGSTVLGEVGHDPNATISKFWIFGQSLNFVADSTTVTFDVVATASGYLEGDNTKNESYATLTELNYTEETTRFT